MSVYRVSLSALDYVELYQVEQQAPWLAVQWLLRLLACPPPLSRIGWYAYQGLNGDVLVKVYIDEDWPRLCGWEKEETNG